MAGLKKEETDNSPPFHVYITGDTHGAFDRLVTFCKEKHPTPRDVIVILGDAGVNFCKDERDIASKELLAHLGPVIFCIHGNHEIRPENLPQYRLGEWSGGKVYVEDRYPNILFAKDGERYTLGGRAVFVMGGAYSVDRAMRVEGVNWWRDEQPSDESKRDVDRWLESRPSVDFVLTHTCPYRYRPLEVFIPSVDQGSVDYSTEHWLDDVESKLGYKRWYCGHYHTEKTIDRLVFLYRSIVELPL